jgi:hypothetical protein
VFALAGWVLAVGLVLVVFSALLPAYFEQLSTVCTGAACASVQPSPDGARALASMGISVHIYAVVALGITIGATVAATLIACTMVLRRPNDWLVLLNAFVVVPLGTASATYAVQESHSAVSMLALTLNAGTFAVFFLATGIFPNGRFVPRWSAAVPVVWLLWSGCYLASRTSLPLASADSAIWLTCCGALMLVQIYRYRVVSSAPERQQTKWILLGGSLTVVVVALAQVPWVVDPAMHHPGSIYQLATEPISQLMDLVFIVSIGIAIVRYRLFDVDLIINRALVYGTLTISLALAYFASVVLLQLLLQRITGEVSNTPALVVTTLAIAALSQPWRRRLQRVIDRRFYRSRYSAARIIEGFATTLRTELDLGELHDRLVTVVEDSMRPRHVSLWLRAPSSSAEDER